MPDVYRITILPSARREFESLHDPLRRRVADTISALRDNPRPHGCRKLVGSESDYRVRVGDYRILYDVNDTQKTVNVYRIRHRERAYS